MFLQRSVCSRGCPNMHWVGAVSQHALGRGMYPSMHLAVVSAQGGVCPRGVCLAVSAQRVLPKGCLPRGVSAQGVYTPREQRQTPRRPEIDTPPDQRQTAQITTRYGQQAGGTHPTGNDNLLVSASQNLPIQYLLNHYGVSPYPVRYKSSTNY